MRNKNCELCNGSGWYGDNGPGRRGNREYVPCENCNPEGESGKSDTVRDDGWHDVEKQLPEKLTYCLVYNIISKLGTGEICWCFYNSNGKWAGDCEFYNNVIAWMPLPQPPQFARAAELEKEGEK